MARYFPTPKQPSLDIATFSHHHSLEAFVRSTLSLSLILLVACSKGAGVPDAVRTDSAGIEIVTSSGTDRPLTWPITPSDTLYDPASDTALSGEARMLALAADGRGGLVLADGGFGDRRVLRLGTDGTMHQVGRRGGGPGEYQMASRVAVSPEGEVLVGDFGKRAFVRFGADDSILPQLDWSAFGKGFAQDANYAAGGIVALFSEQSESTSVRTIRYLSATDTSEIVVTRGGAPKSLDFVKSCGVLFAGNPLFSPQTNWAGGPTSVAYSTTDRYEISIWQGGKLVRIIRRTIPPRAATEALAKQDLGEGRNMIIGNRPCLLPAADIIEQQGFAATIPAIKRISMAKDGTLWVERWTIQGEPLQRDIFDPSGNYLGTLTGDIAWPQAWLPDGQYVGVGADADSMPVVVRYAVGGATRKE